MQFKPLQREDKSEQASTQVFTSGEGHLSGLRGQMSGKNGRLSGKKVDI